MSPIFWARHQQLTGIPPLSHRYEKLIHYSELFDFTTFANRRGYAVYGKTNDVPNETPQNQDWNLFAIRNIL
jgi:hypothetical protein